MAYNFCIQLDIGLNIGLKGKYFKANIYFFMLLSHLDSGYRNSQFISSTKLESLPRFVDICLQGRLPLFQEFRLLITYDRSRVDFIKFGRKAQIIEIALSIWTLHLRPTFWEGFYWHKSWAWGLRAQKQFLKLTLVSVLNKSGSGLSMLQNGRHWMVKIELQTLSSNMWSAKKVLLKSSNSIWDSETRIQKLNNKFISSSIG